jgi:hypothetical protein
VAPAAAAAYIIQFFSGSSAALQRRPERASPAVRVRVCVFGGDRRPFCSAGVACCLRCNAALPFHSTLDVHSIDFISNDLLLAGVFPQIGCIGSAVASTFVSIAVSAPIYHVVAILLGAPLLGLAAKTGLLAVILSVLTTVPLACDMAISTYAGRSEAWYVFIWVLLCGCGVYSIMTELFVSLRLSLVLTLRILFVCILCLRMRCVCCSRVQVCDACRVAYNTFYTYPSPRGFDRCMARSVTDPFRLGPTVASVAHTVRCRGDSRVCCGVVTCCVRSNEDNTAGGRPCVLNADG